jgi:hypothetical protein
VEIGTEAPIFLFWEYLLKFRYFVFAVHAVGKRVSVHAVGKRVSVHCAMQVELEI